MSLKSQDRAQRICNSPPSYFSQHITAEGAVPYLFKITQEKNTASNSPAKAAVGPAVLKLILTYSILGEGEFLCTSVISAQVLKAALIRTGRHCARCDSGYHGYWKTSCSRPGGLRASDEAHSAKRLVGAVRRNWYDVYTEFGRSTDTCCG